MAQIKCLFTWFGSLEQIYIYIYMVALLALLGVVKSDQFDCFFEAAAQQASICMLWFVKAGALTCGPTCFQP
jgi:hypothetical protein